MEFIQSTIVTATVRKVFPLIVIFGIYLFSYGANFPGGGFQAGVALGTIVVLFEFIFEEKKLSDYFYSMVEYIGISILYIALVYGLLLTGFYFSGFYHFRMENLLFSNLYYWFLNLAIFLEVSGSIILIFRHFLEWKNEE